MLGTDGDPEKTNKTKTNERNFTEAKKETDEKNHLRQAH